MRPLCKLAHGAKSCRVASQLLFTPVSRLQDWDFMGKAHPKAMMAAAVMLVVSSRRQDRSYKAIARTPSAVTLSKSSRTEPQFVFAMPGRWRSGTNVRTDAPSPHRPLRLHSHRATRNITPPPPFAYSACFCGVCSHGRNHRAARQPDC